MELGCYSVNDIDAVKGLKRGRDVIYYGNFLILPQRKENTTMMVEPSSHHAGSSPQPRLPGDYQFLQAIFYGVACLEDVLKRAKGQKDIKFITAFRDLLFTTLAFPISAFVFLSFWILFLYDRELVYPKALDGIFPVWLNHAMVSKRKT
ncbi:hypothetical protein J1605_004532 [Eschrichtius robustus]|uniref:Uncharacterized protein n=1 Tax=Eschrichtius robustus TaxID=9764 RepID=A0AB34HGD6_ESCRO|nr:hypothetical protein J1605_004532 [Eschrichtius robustus]